MRRCAFELDVKAWTANCPVLAACNDCAIDGIVINVRTGCNLITRNGSDGAEPAPAELLLTLADFHWTRFSPTQVQTSIAELDRGLERQTFL